MAFECAAGRDVRVMSAYVDVGGDRFEYDELILATGSHYPGVLKAECDGEAGEDRDARMREITEAREDVTKGKSVVVIGGGVVGVEVAGELAARNAKMKSGARVILVHSGPRLLDTLPKFVSEYVSKTLVRFGVEVYVGQTYDRVGDSFVGRMNENVIEGDRVMMCVGAKPATEFLDRESVNFSEDDDAIWTCKINSFKNTRSFRNTFKRFDGFNSFFSNYYYFTIFYISYIFGSNHI